MPSYSISVAVNGVSVSQDGTASGVYSYEDVLPSGSSTFDMMNIENPVVIAVFTDRHGCTFTLPSGSPIPCYPVGVASDLEGMGVSSITVNNPGGEGNIRIVAADYSP